MRAGASAPSPHLLPPVMGGHPGAHPITNLPSPLPAAPCRLLQPYATKFRAMPTRAIPCCAMPRHTAAHCRPLPLATCRPLPPLAAPHAAPCPRLCRLLMPPPHAASLGLAPSHVVASCYHLLPPASICHPPLPPPAWDGPARCCPPPCRPLPPPCCILSPPATPFRPPPPPSAPLRPLPTPARPHAAHDTPRCLLPPSPPHAAPCRSDVPTCRPLPCRTPTNRWYD